MPDSLPVNVDPWQVTIDRLDSKSPVASKMRTREWASVPVEVRERAFFSAGVEDARVLSKMQSLLRSSVDFANRNPDEAFTGRDRFITEMRKFLGAKPGDSRSLTDLESSRRLGLIYDFHQEDLFEYGRWKMGQDPDLLEEFPAQEFLRVAPRDEPRPRSFWPGRWNESGGQQYNGRLIALKNSTVWVKLSRFDKPWPPYDFGSGWGVRDIDIDEAEELGVMDPEQAPPEPERHDLNEGLEASAEGLTPETKRAVRKAMGDQVKISEDKVRWEGGAKVEDMVRRVMSDPAEKARFDFGAATAKTVRRAPALKDKRMVLTDEGIRQATRGRRDMSPAVVPLDFRYAPFIWREPDEAVETEDGVELRWRFGEDTFAIQLRRLTEEFLELIGIRKPRWWNHG